MKVYKAVEGIKEEGRLEGIHLFVTTLRELGQLVKIEMSEDEAKMYKIAGGSL